MKREMTSTEIKRILPKGFDTQKEEEGRTYVTCQGKLNQY